MALQVLLKQLLALKLLIAPIKLTAEAIIIRVCNLVSLQHFILTEFLATAGHRASKRFFQRVSSFMARLSRTSLKYLRAILAIESLDIVVL
jgi:hypothetical protein